MGEADTLSDFHRRREPFSAWFGVVVLFAGFAVLVAVVMAISPRGDHYEQKRAAARTEKLKTARSEADKALTTYAWVDKAKGVARIPIERAMELTMNDLAQRKPAPAGPIAAPPPGGSQGAAPATAAAPAAPAVAPSGTPKATAIEGPSSENRAQNAASSNPPGAQPNTQPGAAATPAASPSAPAGQPPVKPNASPNSTPVQSPPGTPIPVPGKSP